MVKVDHKTKLEIIDLFKSVLKTGHITKRLQGNGCVISRHQVHYWINQFCFGYFNPDGPTSKIREFKKVSVRDIQVVKNSLTLRAFSACLTRPIFGPVPNAKKRPFFPISRKKFPISLKNSHLNRKNKKTQNKRELKRLF